MCAHLSTFRLSSLDSKVLECPRMVVKVVVSVHQLYAVAEVYTLPVRHCSLHVDRTNILIPDQGVNCIWTGYLVPGAECVKTVN